MSSNDNVLNVTISSGEEDDFADAIGDIEHDQHDNVMISDENSDSDDVQINSDDDSIADSTTYSDDTYPDSDDTMNYSGEELDLSQFSTIDENFARDLIAVQAMSKEEVINKNTIIYEYQRSTSSSDPQEACSICLDYLGSGQTIRRLPCFHQFHISCADDWLAKKTQCPECRTKITADVS